MRNNAIDGGSKNTGWAEWGINEESDVNDVELWYKTNPSLGTIFTERSIEDEIGTDDLDFNIQRLGLWIRYNQKSAITQKTGILLWLQVYLLLLVRLMSGLSMVMMAKM
ncbi:hypothetical protein [Finegoldia magna]|uniref:hypothetical protein n=1 Tax=Finegoldia magna TaxID=1260 RepID=UPI0020B78D91|nr:hypothetical protein [Finegoldia magna]